MLAPPSPSGESRVNREALTFGWGLFVLPLTTWMDACIMRAEGGVGVEGMGHITTTLTVWCGHPDCAMWEYCESKTLREAHYEAKDKGWVLTRKYGWLCPECAKKEGEK
jgi:hypothetical protein